MFKFEQIKEQNFIQYDKNLFYPALWGILTLSTLSSCRTEDGAITQNN